MKVADHSKQQNAFMARRAVLHRKVDRLIDESLLALPYVLQNFNVTREAGLW